MWVYDTDHSVKDNSISEDGEEIKTQGFVIPIPPESEEPRDFEFTICRPYACGYYNKNPKHRFCGLTLITDFSIDVISENQIYRRLDDSDSNVEYSAIVSTDSVTDASDVKLKISTYTYKKTNWSSPFYNNDGFQYLQSIGNNASRCGTSARSHHDTVLLGIIDKIPNNQEIIHIAHGLDDIQFIVEALFQGKSGIACRRILILPVALLQPVIAELV